MTRKSTGQAQIEANPKRKRKGKSPKPLPENLNPRQALFVDHYMIHYNATQAAKDAGYSKHTAYSQGHDLLKHPEIKAEITRRRAELAANLSDLSEERIKREIATLAFSNMKDYAPMFGSGTPAEKLALLTREQGAAVQEIVVEEFRDGRSDWREVRRTKFKLSDKGKGLDLLARTMGMITDKVDHKHQVQGMIVHAMLQDIYKRMEGQPIVPLPAPDEDEAAA